MQHACLHVAAVPSCSIVVRLYHSVRMICPACSAGRRATSLATAPTLRCREQEGRGALGGRGGSGGGGREGSRVDLPALWRGGGAAIVAAVGARLSSPACLPADAPVCACVCPQAAAARRWRRRGGEHGVGQAWGTGGEGPGGPAGQLQRGKNSCGAAKGAAGAFLYGPAPPPPPPPTHCSTCDSAPSQYRFRSLSPRRRRRRSCLRRSRSPSLGCRGPWPRRQTASSEPQRGPRRALNARCPCSPPGLPCAAAAELLSGAGGTCRRLSSTRCPPISPASSGVVSPREEQAAGAPSPLACPPPVLPSAELHPPPPPPPHLRPDSAPAPASPPCLPAAAWCCCTRSLPKRASPRPAGGCTCSRGSSSWRSRCTYTGETPPTPNPTRRMYPFVLLAAIPTGAQDGGAAVPVWLRPPLPPLLPSLTHLRPRSLLASHSLLPAAQHACPPGWKRCPALPSPLYYDFR